MCPFVNKRGDIIKKLIAVFLSAFVMILPLTGCFGSDENKEDSDKLSIVTTIFPYYDFVSQIVGDRADVTLLVPPGCEPHDFDFSPKDIVNINNADIFVYNGGESEQWVDEVLDSIETDVKVIKCFDFVIALDEDDTSLENDEESDSDEDEEEYDEHIWTSPKNAIKITKSLYEQIKSTDKINSDYYKANTEDYLQQLKQLDREFTDIVNNANRDTLVFADRFPFLYLTTDYGIKHISAFPGCSSQTQPSISTVITLIDYVNDNNIPVVLHCDFSSENFSQIISEDSNAKIRTLYSCHNVTKDMFESGVTYISLMKSNADVIKEALN